MSEMAMAGREEGVMRVFMDRSYGACDARREGYARRIAALARLAAGGLLGVMMMSGEIRAQTPPAAAKPVKLAVLGDSLTAGHDLLITEAFPARL